MRAETLAVAACHFLDHVQEQLSVGGVHLSKKPSQLLKVAGLSTPKSPCLGPITIRSDCNWGFGRFVAIVHEVVERKFQCSGHFLQRFDCRNGMTILDARDVAAKQACALFNVTLRELLFLTKFAESFADNHLCSPPSKDGQMHSLRFTELGEPVHFTVAIDDLQVGYYHPNPSVRQQQPAHTVRILVCCRHEALPEPLG